MPVVQAFSAQAAMKYVAPLSAKPTAASPHPASGLAGSSNRSSRWLTDPSAPLRPCWGWRTGGRG